MTYNGGATFEDSFLGENSAVSAISGGYSVTIDPISPFIAGQSVTVEVTATANGLPVELA